MSVNLEEPLCRRTVADHPTRQSTVKLEPQAESDREASDSDYETPGSSIQEDISAVDLDRHFDGERLISLESIDALQKTQHLHSSLVIQTSENTTIPLQPQTKQPQPQQPQQTHTMGNPAQIAPSGNPPCFQSLVFTGQPSLQSAYCTCWGLTEHMAVTVQIDLDGVLQPMKHTTFLAKKKKKNTLTPGYLPGYFQRGLHLRVRGWRRLAGTTGQGIFLVLLLTTKDLPQLPQPTNATETFEISPATHTLHISHAKPTLQPSQGRPTSKPSNVNPALQPNRAQQTTHVRARMYIPRLLAEAWSLSAGPCKFQLELDGQMHQQQPLVWDSHIHTYGTGGILVLKLDFATATALGNFFLRGWRLAEDSALVMIASANIGVVITETECLALSVKNQQQPTPSTKANQEAPKPQAMFVQVPSRKRSMADLVSQTVASCNSALVSRFIDAPKVSQMTASKGPGSSSSLPSSLPEIGHSTSTPHPIMVQAINSAIVQALRLLETPCKAKLAVAAAVRTLSTAQLCGFVDSAYPWIQQAFIDRDKEGLKCHLESALGVDLS